MSSNTPLYPIGPKGQEGKIKSKPDTVWREREISKTSILLKSQTQCILSLHYSPARAIIGLSHERGFCLFDPQTMLSISLYKSQVTL